MTLAKGPVVTQCLSSMDRGASRLPSRPKPLVEENMGDVVRGSLEVLVLITSSLRVASRSGNFIEIFHTN